MEARFKYHGLIDDVTFIEAIPRESPLVDYYAQGLTCPHLGQDGIRKWRGELACYASHLKAVRQLLHDGRKMALICEDDILLANNFLERYVAIIQNKPQDAPLVTMSYMLTDYGDSHWAGINPEKRNLLTIDPVNTWGAQIYWLTQEYAQQVITTYDKPFKDVPYDLRTSEVIIRHSKGYMAYPPLAIEEGIDSDREPNDLPYHHHHFKFWGYHNYSASEKEHLSPLKDE